MNIVEHLRLFVRYERIKIMFSRNVYRPGQRIDVSIIKLVSKSRYDSSLCLVEPINNCGKKNISQGGRRDQI